MKMNNTLQLFKRLIQTFFIISGFVLIAGCEGYTCATGVIYDNATKEPLDSVLCKVLTGSYEQYSDSIGQYDVCNDFGGCFPKCPDIEVKYTKIGYKTKTLTNPKSDKIYLEKE